MDPGIFGAVSVGTIFLLTCNVLVRLPIQYKSTILYARHSAKLLAEKGTY
jgi:hypothetical protein